MMKLLNILRYYMKGLGINMNWLLIVVLAILIINTIIGMRVGFIKTVFSLCSMIVALILTIWISPYVNNFMRGNEKFYHSVSEKVEKVLPLIEDKTEEKGENSLIEGLSLPKSLKDSLIKNNNKKVYNDLKVNTFKEYISSYLTGIVINALAFSVTFIVLLVLLWIISIALNIISKLPFLNQINKTGGLLAGLLHGLVVVWLFFIVLTVFESSELGQEAMTLIGGNEILSFIYNNNFLIGFITNATKMLL